MLFSEQDTTAQPVNGFADESVFAPGNKAGASFMHALAKWLRAIKEDRPDAFNGHAGELAWDLLLDLFLREAAGKATSVSSAGIGSPMPPTTALRHVTFLCETDWLRRTPDENDKRRFWLTLSPQAKTTIEEFLAKRCNEFSNLSLIHVEEIFSQRAVDIFGMLERAQGELAAETQKLVTETHRLGAEFKHMIAVLR